jgi:Rps23 Pro-64 3,4-dihydroxylase Tpa1-like proline 4-hydroxylase
MEKNKLLNPDLFLTQTIHDLEQQFNSNKPIRHLVTDNFLDRNFAHRICDHFPAVKEMKTHYHGINEKKSEHSDFSKLDDAFSSLHEELSSVRFIEWLTEVTSIKNLEPINDRLGYGLHQGANNSFLDIHIDYNLHPVKRKYRKLNFILFFNKQWEKNWGGNLELWDDRVQNCIQSISPLFNRCVIFECSEVSYHGYSRITVPEHITRKSYYQYYFIPAENDISFHDTIFKSRPEESAIKKLLTPAKDFLKNSAKKTLLKLGLKKFLE